MLTVVIADDELAARRRLKRLLADERDVTIVGEFADGAAAIDGIRRLCPDVALLDIQMPEGDGLEVARATRGGAHAPAVVFVTAFDTYALRAFEVHAIDYLVKPIDPARLRETFERLRSRVAGPDSTELARLAGLIEEMRRDNVPSSGARKRLRDRLLVAVDGRSLLITVTDLDWIEAAGNYVRLHRGSTSLLMRESLSSVEASLDPRLFARVHRGAVVNIARIKEVQPWFSGAAIIILTTGQRLTVSRSYRKQFEDRFGVRSPE